MAGLHTPLCDQLGIAVPVVQAPVGSAAGPRLAAAVSEAGGLGSLALTWCGADRAREQIRQARSLTGRPFAANLVLDFPVDDTLAVCLAEEVPVVSTFWGDPAPVHDRIRAAGALHLHVVGTVDEALHAVGCGVDVIVAQGWEAGGHVRGEVTTMALVPAVVDAVGPVPVVAAGGIADGRGLLAALALGAQAAWLGTRFVATPEAHAHPDYHRHLTEAGAADTVHTGCFDGGWPAAPPRALRNPTTDAWVAAGRPSAPDRPGEGDIVATDDLGHAHARYEDLIPLPGMTGELAEMAMYAGQSVELVRDVRPAADVVHGIMAEARRLAEQLAEPS
jgi:NAD(P)H-dependent flavin oxidoreductase YrpB (nitropropane dioxygenase family)